MLDRSRPLALLSILLAVPAIVGCTQCNISQEEARSIVLNELARQSLDPQFLSKPKSTPDRCSVDFEYRGHGTEISYVVASDPIHGLELRKWDHARDSGP